MTSITDCVVEGLKYPFNDLKKVLSFGVLFALINLISLDITTKFIDAVMKYSKLYPSASNVFHLSQLPANDIYMIIALLIISFIIVLFINGYEWNIVRFSIDKKEDLPEFSNVLKMFVNGVKYFLVNVAYNIIPIVLLIIGLALFNESYSPIIILISVLLFLIAYFILIMALNNMVAHDSIKKAFDLREITKNISNLGWGKYIGIIVFTLIVYLVIMVAVGVILFFITVFIISAITDQSMIISIFLAIIEGLFILPYVEIFFSRVFGSIYRESIK
ncbi:DUF4013 domain-containing protein [Methanobrevibacter gottschalkii]|uniref:DUF4013 domain-containing protein n=1 Tax=Methanobrevibacter gottschalkii TaxID=190974 RepID=UPI0038D15E70